MFSTFRIKEGIVKTNFLKLLITVIALKGSFSFAADLPKMENSPKSWYQSFNEDDQKGTLSMVKESVDRWNFIDGVADNHDLPDAVRGDLRVRRSFITSNILKFFERKISEEGRNEEGNDAFVALAKINSGLKPKGSMGLSDNFKIRFKGQLLRGYGTMMVVNPYFGVNVIMDLSKGAAIEGTKKIESLDVNSTLNYSLKRHMTTIKVDKNFADDLNAGITYQNGETTHGAGDVELKLMYSRPF